MGQSRQAWSRVGEHFGSLGDNLKGHGTRAASEVASTKPDQAAIAEAFSALGQAIDKAAASVSGAVKDPEVRRDAKNALNAMGGALTTSFAEAGDAVSDTMKTTFGSAKSATPGDDAPSPGDDETRSGS